MASRKPEQPTNTKVSRPADTDVRLEHKSGGRLIVRLPRGGLSDISIYLLVFCVLFFLIVGGADYLISLQEPDLFATLTFPLNLVLPAFGLAGGILVISTLYSLFGRVCVVLDRRSIAVRRELFGIGWGRRRPLDEVADIGPAATLLRHGPRRPNITGIGINLGGRWNPIVFGSGLRNEEQQWLIGELRDFLEISRHTSP